MSGDTSSVFGDGAITIPAHPLAVTDDGVPDWESQRVVTQYYCEAGVSGLAVGVHTTQFEIHHDQDLLRRTYAEAADVVASAEIAPILVAGVAGETVQAVREAELAASLGYQVTLLCPYGMSSASPDALLERARAVAEVLPTLGFYMQESVGGTYLPESYWHELFRIPGVVGAKAAPFSRYRTRDVMAALAASGRHDELVVVTGNDDAIVSDLTTPWRFVVDGEDITVRIRGGLLGQWAVGAKSAVELTRQAVAGQGSPVGQDLLASGADLVTINQALFDTVNDFSGAVAGVNELLRQQGLMRSARCLSQRERLSSGQAELIAGVRARYPDLLDEAFVAEHRDRWRDLAR